LSFWEGFVDLIKLFLMFLVWNFIKNEGFQQFLRIQASHLLVSSEKLFRIFLKMSWNIFEFLFYVQDFFDKKFPLILC
jgi:hypothetical protein